jgi:hypothetical protein
MSLNILNCNKKWILMSLILQIFFSENSTLYTTIPEVINGLEELCISINEFLLLLFGYMKYIFALILMILGVMTLLRYRGIFMLQRYSYNLHEKKEKFKEKLKKTHVILGIVYIFTGFGIIFNYLIYILIWCLDPLPDRLIFQFIDIGGMIEPQYILRISNINLAMAPHEKTIYLCFAYISLFSLIQISTSIWFISKGGQLLNHPILTYSVLISGVMEGILAGFTTCLPFMI